VEGTKSNFLWSIRISITGKKGFGDIEDAFWDFSSSIIVLIFFEDSTDMIHPIYEVQNIYERA
jgi:hypothetical protein